jgi:VacB/RNase II family 3'-5' exoribonuclease
MLNDSALSQLKQIKQQIEDKKEHVEGQVKGTRHRFGFLVLDDGREIYISPDEMLKVLPGDTVKAEVISDGKSKPSASIEAIKSSTLHKFTGRYIVKGKGHFIEPDVSQFSRWIFIPPSARKKAEHNQLIQCEITRHPYPHTKPQAKVISVIGSLGQAGIEADYMMVKYGLNNDWPKNWEDTLCSDTSEGKREDLTKLSFITIDGEQTLDMDDALFAESCGDGWALFIAIADPTTIIPQGSALALEAKNRGASLYFPDRTIPMLPEKLSIDRCALSPEKTRPALVCKLSVSANGIVKDYTITEALIQSKAKLSYQAVADHCNKTDNTIAFPEVIQQLVDVSSALRIRRGEDHLLIDDRPDYQPTLDEQGKIQSITVMQKTIAHRIVEESMVAANRCAADILGEEGIFISHPGFRKERSPDVIKLADEQLGIQNIDHQSFDGYIQLMKSIDNKKTELPLRSVLSRMLSRSELSNKVLPHYGMGLKKYTTFTSPLRKYSDFLVHRLIKAKLHSEPSSTPDQETLNTLQQKLLMLRNAQSEVRKWLHCQYLQPRQGTQMEGVIAQINSRGFTVRLIENGIEGMIETRLLPEKFSFDPMRMRLKSKTQLFELDQTVQVTIAEIDTEQCRIRLALAQNEDT